MYLTFHRFSAELHPEDLSFALFYRPSGETREFCFLRGTLSEMVTLSCEPLSPDAYTVRNEARAAELERVSGGLRLSGKAVPDVSLDIELARDGAILRTGGRAKITLRGHFFWPGDDAEDVFALRDGDEDELLVCGIGPACGAGDDALYDRRNDRLLFWQTSGDFRLGFDWKEKAYAFSLTCGVDFGRAVTFSIREDELARRSDGRFRPIRKKHGFRTPPAGWMTWYAVQFAASEKIVLDNARKLKARFGGYADKLVVWVDWEWCHGDFSGQGEDGADIFHPRRSAYPHGLGYVADRIRALGLVPAVWVGASNEGRLNPLLAAHPEWVLAQEVRWCGQYWVDLTRPEVHTEYLAPIFRQLTDWGFRVVKWDCLPLTITMHEKYHDRVFDKTCSPEQAFRNAAATARKTLGDDVYLLSCSGGTTRDILGAMDRFDAARIGGDVFEWKSFVGTAERVLHFYCWHNTAFYADADNLVLRPEFNTENQARSRVSFYGLAGLPVTIGDPIDELDAARTGMLRKILPTADVHPRALEVKRAGRTLQILHLAVSRPFAGWSVAGVVNFSGRAVSKRLDFAADLRLAAGRYAVWDFWRGEFLGVAESRLTLGIGAYDTRVLRLTPLEDESRPVWIASSRHITQGAVEMRKLKIGRTSVSGETLCVKGDPVRLAFLLPEHAEVTECAAPHRQRGRLLELSLRGDGVTAWKYSWRIAKK